jgi:hypothetical protein
MSNAAKIISNAEAVAHRYRKRAPWADYEDVRQAAALAMSEAEARSGFDETRGVEIGAYYWRAAVYAARMEVHQARSPVSHRHRVERLRELRSEGMFVVRGSQSREPELQERSEIGAGQESVDETAHRMQIAQRVRERIAAVLGDSWVDMVIGVMGEGWSPAEIAEQSGVEVADVYKLVRQATTALMQDRALFALWNNQ